MKKIMTLAAIFAAVMMGISSCNPDDTNPEQKPNTEQSGDETPGDETPGDETPGDETPGDETPGDEYVAPITIDGNFDDWAALDATKVAVAENAGEMVGEPALYVLKVYADAEYLHLYFEFDEDIIADRAWVPFHIYLNTDGDTTTGGFGDQWSDACVDHMFEGACMAEDAFCSWDGSLSEWCGETNGTGWDGCWLSLLESVQATGAGAGNAYELKIPLNAEGGVGEEGLVLADTFGIGVDIQQEWNSVGILPNAEQTEDDPTGLAPMLSVTVDR